MPQTAVPPLTDADREAVFFGPATHTVHDKAVSWFLLLDQVEWRALDDGDGQAWDVEGWIGGDINRLWLRSEGERISGATHDAELQVLWGHAISPWWNAVVGVRQDFEPGDPQTWATVGLQGLALYSFEVEATAFVGEGGRTAARLEAQYDMLLTNRLVLQPTAEVNFHGKQDVARGIGSGLSSVEVGLRLRYEIRREFAPYLGVAWRRSYGDTTDLARKQGAEVEDTSLVVGVRMWF